MLLSFLHILSLIALATASNIAVYWGQNAGSNQQSLGTYCSSTSASIIILSFLDGFPNLLLNFANQCSTSFSSGLLHCPQIGSDIKSCQLQGKIILLSLGGATGDYGFSSDSEATSFATDLWNRFGGGSSDERPFDDAVVDGFDFDIENKQQTGYVALANQLRSYFSTASKTYYLSAAPQCPYPDESVGDLMSQVDLDFAFIQFYNNYCSLDKQFNWDTWSQYASGKNIKLYLGLPGSSSSAGSGFVGISTVQSALASISSDSHFGGISLWDVSSAENSGFLDQVAAALSGSSSIATTTTTSSSGRSSSRSSSNYYTTNAPNTPSTSVYTPYTYSTQVTAISPSTTSTHGGFLGWLGGLFGGGSSTTSQGSPVATPAPTQPAAATPAATTPVAVTAAPSPTTTSHFNWFGLFGSTTTSTTLATIYSTVPADQVVYVTLTTTVYHQTSPSLLAKRDTVAEGKATGLNVQWSLLFFIPILVLICS
ncbi:Chitinase 1 [Candida viswanathii]|uniref:chitinase n=1 Tax=Candida viswanathii TaxID=5486 RepID=A0A367YAD5_9ASCO|nr:Chitinase 1 [Candida viswanathii]